MPHPTREVLSNKLVRSLSPPTTGQYIVRDKTLAGFFVVVGKAAKTYTIQVDTRRLGARKTTRQAIGRAEDWDAGDARKKAKSVIGALQTGASEATARRTRVTLGSAWESYRKLLGARVAAGERSQRTLDGYKGDIERYLSAWLDTPLRDLSDDPAGVAKRHQLRPSTQFWSRIILALPTCFPFQGVQGKFGRFCCHASRHAASIFRTVPRTNFRGVWNSRALTKSTLSVPYRHTVFLTETARGFG